jgi:hypothetical protein
MSTTSTLIEETIKDEYLLSNSRITEIEIGKPIDGEGTPFKVFVTYENTVGEYEYHRTFYATITGDTCKLEEDEEDCINAECWCLDEDR